MIKAESLISEVTEQLLYQYKKSVNTEVYKLLDGSLCNVDAMKLNLLVYQGEEFIATPHIRIGESKVHGRGVFATKEIPIGSLVTFYPADLVTYFPNKNQEIEGPKNVVGFESERCKEDVARLTFQGVRECIEDYEFTIDEHYAIYGHPKYDLDVQYLGHFVNDRFKPDGNKITPQMYLHLSSSRANCMFYVFERGLAVGIVSIATVKEGQELFVTYGKKYWESRCSTQSKDHETSK